MRKTLDHDLLTIRDSILRMGSLVYKATQHSLEAFSANDIALALEVMRADEEIDALHRKVEHDVTTTLALWQPLAINLRRLIAAMLIAGELERMGDHAKGIARMIVRRPVEGQPYVPPLLGQMVEHIREMIYEAMGAFVAADPKQARAVAAMDDHVDEMYARLFEDALNRMRTGEISVEHGTHIMRAGQKLERIADRVTNICERVLYSSTGDISELNEKSA